MYGHKGLYYKGPAGVTVILKEVGRLLFFFLLLLRRKSLLCPSVFRLSGMTIGV